MTVTRWCSGCAADAAFERFDCAEHPEECIELVCVLCGTGIEFAPLGAAETEVRVSPAA
jgi:hypothetical protein